MKQKAVFIDKDGTIIKDVPYNVNPRYIELLPHVVDGLVMLQKTGYQLVIITNQSGIARGLFAEEALEEVRKTIEMLLSLHTIALAGFYYCPHHPKGKINSYRTSCSCRKPMPGMLLQAAADLQIDLKQSWMIGDILNDVEAGKKAGCKTILIDNGNETEWEADNSLRFPDYVAKNLTEAARVITSLDEQHTTYRHEKEGKYSL